MTASYWTVQYNTPYCLQPKYLWDVSECPESVVWLYCILLYCLNIQATLNSLELQELGALQKLKKQPLKNRTGLMWNTAELCGVLNEWVAIFVGNRAQFSVINTTMPWPIFDKDSMSCLRSRVFTDHFLNPVINQYFHQTLPCTVSITASNDTVG